MIEYYQCSYYKEDGAVCVTFKDQYGSGINGADCLGEKYECSKAGEERTVCDEYYEEIYSEKCTKASNDKLYWAYVSGSADYCYGYCNDDGTECIEDEYDYE